MAKRKTESDEVEVVAVAGFKHRGAYVFTGERCLMERSEVAGMRLLNMIRELKAEESTDG